MPNSKYLCARQVRERLNIGNTTLWDLVKRGGLPPPHRFGRRVVRWNLSELEDFEVEAKRERERSSQAAAAA